MSWTRPSLPERRPNRNIGGLGRSADIDEAGTTLAGVPMQTVSDAVMATVKLGYKVADRQIARGRRMGRTLHGAAQRAGAKDANAVIDNTERLVAQAMGMGLEWLEGAATAEQGPVRRVLKAEYKLLGRLFGLLADDGGAPSPARAPTGGPAPSDPSSGNPGAEAPAVRPAPAAAPTPAKVLLVRHRAAADQRRDVRVVHAQWRAEDDAPIDVHFHHRSGGTAVVLPARLERLKGRDVLALTTSSALPAGAWRAAVCNADGLQIGTVEIEL